MRPVFFRGSDAEFGDRNSSISSLIHFVLRLLRDVMVSELIFRNEKKLTDVGFHAFLRSLQQGDVFRRYLS